MSLPFHSRYTPAPTPLFATLHSSYTIFAETLASKSPPISARMAQITYNSRLVEMEIAGAAPVPVSNDLITVRDGRNRSMIFSVGSDNVFRIILGDTNLTLRTIDFGAALRVKEGEKITAYDVRQALDSTMYIVAATGRDDTPSWGRVFILIPFLPSKVDLIDTEAIKRLVIPQI